MSMLTGNTLWGSGQPFFRLIMKPGQSARQMQRLPGKFTFTSGSAIVVTTEDLRSYLEAGEVLTPNRDIQGKMYFVQSVDSSSQVTLSEVFGEDTLTSVNGYTDSSKLRLPYCTTIYSFTPERFDGGGIQMRLANNGRILNRAEGFRVRLVFRWELMERPPFEKLVTIFSHMVNGSIEVQPHDDVKIKWRMIPVGELSPEWPNDKLVATNITIGFINVDLIKQIPILSNTWEGGPSII